MFPPSPEQVAKALSLLSTLKRALQDNAENYALKLEYGAESEENRSLREHFRHLAEQVQQAELTLQGPRYKPVADDLPDDEGWVAKRRDGVEFAIRGDEPANPDSVVRERA